MTLGNDGKKQIKKRAGLFNNLSAFLLHNIDCHKSAKLFFAMTEQKAPLMKVYLSIYLSVCLSVYEIVIFYFSHFLTDKNKIC